MQSGSNALHCAALNGHAHTIRVLIPSRCDPNLQRRDGWTPLHLACWNGHYEAARELVEGTSCKINARTEEGLGALHLAAAKGFDDIAQLLLNAGIAPDMQDKVRVMMSDMFATYSACYMHGTCMVEPQGKKSCCFLKLHGMPTCDILTSRQQTPSKFCPREYPVQTAF